MPQPLRHREGLVEFVSATDAAPDGTVLDLTERESARRWLRPRGRDLVGMARYRRLVRAHTGGMDAVSDTDVIDALAGLLARRVLRVIVRPDPMEVWLLDDEKPAPHVTLPPITWNRLPPVNFADTTITHEPPPRWETTCTVVDLGDNAADG